MILRRLKFDCVNVNDGQRLEGGRLAGRVSSGAGLDRVAAAALDNKTPPDQSIIHTTQQRSWAAPQSAAAAAAVLLLLLLLLLLGHNRGFCY